MLAAAFVAGSALADFSAPFTIARGAASNAQVAIDADGDAVFVWLTDDGSTYRLRARTRSAQGALGPIRTLTSGPRFVESFDIEVDSDGDALVIWKTHPADGNKIRTRSLSAAGVLGPIQTHGEGYGPVLAVAPGGAAAIGWTRTLDDLAKGRTRSAKGVLGPVRIISRVGVDASDLQVATDAGGDALFAWRNFAESTIETRALSAAGTAGKIQTVSRGYADEPRVGVHADGSAIISWEFKRGIFKARSRSPSGALGPIRTLTQCGENPRISLSENGEALFTWLSSCRDRVQARSISSAWELGPTQSISRAPGSGALVGLDAGGNAVFAWSQSADVRVRTRSVAGALGPIKTVSGDDLLFSYEFHDLAVGTGGDAIVTWRPALDPQNRIRAVAGP